MQQMVWSPNRGWWFHYTDLHVIRLHVVIPGKQSLETGRINLGDAGEIQNDVVTACFLSRQNQDLDAWRGSTTILSSQGKDFRGVMLLFPNLKHRTYLLAKKGILLSHSESFFSGRNNPPIEVGGTIYQQI
jgi:hypothetical protein